MSDTTIKELEATRASLSTKLDELKDESQSKWSTMKASLAKSMDTLNKKVQEAMK